MGQLALSAIGPAKPYAAGLIGLTALASAAACVCGAIDLAAHAAPALLLFAMLAAGKYPGERVLSKFAGASRTRCRRPLSPRPRRVAQIARKASPLAEHIAGRPPPWTPVAAA